jgi:hypothetical protein
MLKIWDASNFRRTLGGLSLILAPVLFATVEITHPAHGSDATTLLAQAAQDRGLTLADIYILIASSILFIPAFFALLHVVRGRGAVLAHIAGALGLAGVSLGLTRAGFQLMIWAMASPGVDQHAMKTFLHQSAQNPAGLPIFLGPLLLTIGLILFGIAVWHAEFGFRWAGPLIALGFVVAVVGGSAGLPDLPVAIGSAALWVLGLAAIGLKLLTMPDAAWESRTLPLDLSRRAVPAPLT